MGETGDFLDAAFESGEMDEDDLFECEPDDEEGDDDDD